MKIGDIVLIPFPFAELTNIKIRPAVVISETADQYKDVVVSAISSVVPKQLSRREIVLQPNLINMLRVQSVIKVDRIVTLKREDKIADLGKLSNSEVSEFKAILTEMIK
ncbi:MAG: type II toxin-antitoxin system PemK/MazF family toxin [Bacteroidetes bacterium]|nr:MAG: type II toxin-antitoxin system PemK/MazF family toxin [Bacteroidota bacterium]